MEKTTYVTRLSEGFLAGVQNLFTLVIVLIVLSLMFPGKPVVESPLSAQLSAQTNSQNGERITRLEGRDDLLLQRLDNIDARISDTSKELRKNSEDIATIKGIGVATGSCLVFLQFVISFFRQKKSGGGGSNEVV